MTNLDNIYQLHANIYANSGRLGHTELELGQTDRRQATDRRQIDGRQTVYSRQANLCHKLFFNYVESVNKNYRKTNNNL